MIDAWATETHYLDHIAPIWVEMRIKGINGTLWVHPRIAEYAEQIDVDARVSKSPPGTGPIIVASFRDLMPCGNRRVVFLQHGSGQSYSNRNPAYAGGDGRDFVELFLEPGEIPAARERERYPDARVVVVGCPKLDDWHAGHLKKIANYVGITFHFDASVCPESHSAFRHFETALPELKEHFGTVIGHAHPRQFDAVAPVYERAGIVPVRDFEEVMQMCGVLAVDNSSVMYEFASLGNPVVLMNAPWYRRQVSHGMRFWDHANMGPNANGPEELIPAIKAALAGECEERRREVVDEVYFACDGQASLRAVSAIGGWA